MSPESPAASNLTDPIGDAEAEMLARDLRERHDVVIVLTSSGSGTARMHVPEHPEDEEDFETLCNGIKSWREPRRKSIDVFPPGWFPWCSLCAVNALEDLEVAPGQPIRAQPNRSDGDE